MNGTPGMYLYVYQCKECKAYGTDRCPWLNVIGNAIACELFEHKIPTTSFTGTASSNGSIDNTCSTTINTDEL